MDTWITDPNELWRMDRRCLATYGRALEQAYTAAARSWSDFVVAVLGLPSQATRDQARATAKADGLVTRCRQLERELDVLFAAVLEFESASRRRGL